MIIDIHYEDQYKFLKSLKNKDPKGYEFKKYDRLLNMVEFELKSELHDDVDKVGMARATIQAFRDVDKEQE